MSLMLVATVTLLLSTTAFHYARMKEAQLFNETYRENSEVSILSILKTKEKELEKTASDYAVWDEMVAFVKSKDKIWAKNNIEAPLYTLDMNYAAIYSTDFDLQYEISDTVRLSLLHFSIPKQEVEIALSNKNICHFFKTIPEGVIEIAGSPIVNSPDVEKKGKRYGYLIWGRLWDRSFLKTLEKSTNSSVEIIPIQSLQDKNVLDDIKEKKNIVIHVFISGSSGFPIARLDFISKTQLQLKQTLFYFYTLIPILFTLLMGIIFFFAFRSWVSKPLQQILVSLKTEDPDYLTHIQKSNAEFHSIARMIVAFFEAKKKVERNILERKTSEERILKLSMAVEQSSEMVVITDPDGQIEYVNKRFYELTGYTRGEAVGKNPRILKSGHHPPEFYSDLWSTISSGNVWKGEFLNRKKNGELFWEDTRISPVKNREGAIINYLAVKSDITERKHDEQRLKEYADELKESNLSKDKFFSILAHDLKSPFHSLLGYTEILSNDYDTLSDAERRKFIQILRNSTKSVFELVENLLQWSRLQSGRLEYSPELFDISDEIEYSVDIMRATALKKNIELINQVTLPTLIFADKNMVQSILQNLISNALKFTMNGGSVFISALPAGDSIEFSIRDTGVGISDEDIEKLFRIDVFYTRKGTAQETGTGLGLILCKELVQKNNGTIRVESKLDKGSNFLFTLPKS